MPPALTASVVLSLVLTLVLNLLLWAFPGLGRWIAEREEGVRAIGATALR